MNQSLLLHVVERLETFVGKLPAAIQKPILHELTPLKELFLQQRAPRLLLVGADQISPHELVAKVFEFDPAQGVQPLVVHRWQEIAIQDHGTLSVFDARGGDLPASAAAELKEELPDVIVYVHHLEKRRKKQRTDDLEAIVKLISTKERERPIPVIELLGGAAGRKETGPIEALTTEPDGFRIVGTFDLKSLGGAEERKRCIGVIARELPNSARLEMARISKDRAVQTDIAYLLVKSTTAVCTAIGAQPIPLADLPVLTTLQLVMVSGIMYVSGRERSLRAATEFIGALGVNVGAGMLLREGARAILKFFPGWGNVVCGMVAGAGTYAMGRAATAFFIHGVSIKDARRTYLSSKKERSRGQPKGGKRRLRAPRNGQQALDHNL